jgi:sarcosine oxidase subunit gamma
MRYPDKLENYEKIINRYAKYKTEMGSAGVEDVLARLVPVDLRANVFKMNHVAKTMLGHMSVTIVRTGAEAFEIMVMRSMAQTLVHDLDVAMRGLAAR